MYVVPHTLQYSSEIAFLICTTIVHQKLLIIFYVALTGTENGCSCLGYTNEDENIIPTSYLTHLFHNTL